MTKQQFIEDLQKIYDFLDNQKAKTNELLKFLENEEFAKLTLIEEKTSEFTCRSDLGDGSALKLGRRKLKTEATANARAASQ